MNRIEQIINEIIAQRPYRAHAWKPTKRKGRFGGSGERYLTEAEVLELQQHVRDCMTAKALCTVKQ